MVRNPELHAQGRGRAGARKVVELSESDIEMSTAKLGQMAEIGRYPPDAQCVHATISVVHHLSK
ncbi:hypothetical protein H3V53_36595 [Paraburkholderia bengalensis]|uniref:Uncharacterized protein n=1 Tax=Paraburkholderia bengalensis TaxID=2747562 RepID=A0ABU8J431_9BURK